jgi:putative inorganic carbon (HCO3(-)) transporter
MQYLIAITVIIAPFYQWRFGLLGLPVNFLMLWVFFIWIIFTFWLWRGNNFKTFFVHVKNLPRWSLVAAGLMVLAASLSLFVGGFNTAKLAQYMVLFIQPISLLFISSFVFKVIPQSKGWLITAMYVFLAASGLFAVYQYYTLVGVPPQWWGNSVEPKRALTFFNHPNAFALFITPVLALLLPDIFNRLKKLNLSSTLYALSWLIGVLGLIYSLSRGGWIGFALAFGVFIILNASKKLIIAGMVVLALAGAIVMTNDNFRYRLILPFHGEKQVVARFTVWQVGVNMIKDSPIFGKGIKGYGDNWHKYNYDTTLQESHNYPHNIFLDFWVETGLLGLLSFVLVVLVVAKQGIVQRNNIYKLGVLLFLVAIIGHGLVDNPYFKNDLALVFWLVLAIGL